MSSIVSTPIQRCRKHPKLIKELEACKTRNWWPEVAVVSSCQHQSSDQIRYINSLRKVSSLSKASWCLPFRLPLAFKASTRCASCSQAL